MLSEQDSVANVSVGFKAPCGSLHTKLYKFRQNISESPNISVAYQKLHRPYPWRGSFIFQKLNFIYILNGFDFSGAPNGGFLLNALKTFIFRLSRELLDLY